MPEIHYPHTQPPEFGTTYEILPGIRWIRMPLPLSLDHINLYLLEDSDGWWIVDTGIKGENVRGYWQQIFNNELNEKPIKGLIATHMHPDHIGQAGWISNKFKVPLYMTYKEYFAALAFSRTPTEDFSWTSEAYYRSAGFNEEYIEQSKKNFHSFSRVVEPLPGAFNRLEDGQVFTIGGNDWQVVTGEGHSPEHACLYCKALNVMLTGDQIIARISPNVSVMYSEPEANPLARWLKSLRKFQQFPDETLLLPAHHLPFKGLSSRLEALITHHHDHLIAIQQACVEAKTAFQLLPVLFKRNLDSSQMAMAIGECVAHLNYLLKDNKLIRTKDEQGVYHYRCCDPETVSQTQPINFEKDIPLQI